MPLDELDEIMAAVRTAQAAHYRAIAAMSRDEKIRCGAYVYFSFLKPFADIAGVGDELDWTVPRDLPAPWYQLLLRHGGREPGDRTTAGDYYSPFPTGSTRPIDDRGRDLRTAGRPPWRLDPATRAATNRGREQFWNESWYLDWTNEEGTLGGYVRLGLYPNMTPRAAPRGTGPAWSGEDRPLVTVIDHDAPIPPGRSLEIRTEGLWADHTVETPARSLHARLRGVRGRRRRPGRGVRRPPR